jgi:hypothetical protein
MRFQQMLSFTRSVAKFHAAISISSLVHIMESLRATSGRGKISLGTGFTGSGVVMKWIDSLTSYWKTAYNVAVEVEELFQCDSDPDVQDFCTTEWGDCELLFRRVEDPSCPRAFDCKSGSFKPIPFVDIFIGGFVCKTKSGYNSQRRQSGATSCVQRGEGSTGESYLACIQYIRKCKPRVVVLENVKNLASKSVATDMSDLEYIINDLTMASYAVHSFLVDSNECGSVQKRVRWYLVGYLNAPSKLSLCRELLPQIKIDTISLTDVLGVKCISEIASAWPDLVGHDLQPRAGKKKDYSFRDEHLKWYKACGIDCPPELDAFPVGLRTLCANLTERQAEVLIYAEEAEPYGGIGEFQYSDLNCSLQFHVGKDGKGYVFSSTMPTLACSTILCVRSQLSQNERVWKLIRGRDLMKIIGFYGMIGDHDAKLCQKLAGNAFSGFSAGAVVLAVIGGLGAR